MRKEQELATTASSKGRQLNGYSFQGNNPIEDIDLRQQHCLGRRFHILTGMKFLILIGVIAIITILVLESIYFRKAIFILLIPTSITISTVIGIIKQSSLFIWPIIGISFFHIILALYVLMIFMYYFIFKPVYILMILNWAFDTITTVKGPLFYVKCACIVAILIAFILLNFWQLRLSLRFCDFLRHQESLQCLIINTSSRSINAKLNNNSFFVQPHSKMLNEPPVIFQNSIGHQSRLSQLPPLPPQVSALKYTLRDETSLNAPNRRSSMYSQSNIMI